MIFSTPGQLHIWYSSGNPSAPYEVRVIDLRTAQLSVGSNFLSPTTGISYIARRDTLVVSLADGSFHEVQDLTKLPSSPRTSNIAATSEMLSATARSVCSSVCPDGLHLADVNQINGMLLYDEGSTFVWVLEYVISSLIGIFATIEHWAGLPGLTNLIISTMQNTRAYLWQPRCGLIFQMTKFWIKLCRN